MLKISTIDCNRRRCIVVEGKLIEPWTAELDVECEEARADLGVRELVVDLRSVTAISREGEDVLFRLMCAGLKIYPHGVFTRHVVRQLARRLRACLEGSPGNH